MKRILSYCVVIALFLLLNSHPGARENEKVIVCCYTHPGYQGLCRVQPGEGESCESILDYLNTPGTAGKTYCSGSILRGGWQQVECTE